MAKYSHAQLEALARIRFWGLDTSFGDLETDDSAFAHLNTPQGVRRVSVNRLTARRLARDRLIEAVPEDQDPDGLPGRWTITGAGHELLKQYPEYLATAGKEHAAVMGRLALSR